jgi:hypothetical protein
MFFELFSGRAICYISILRDTNGSSQEERTLEEFGVTASSAKERMVVNTVFIVFGSD